MFDLIFMMGLFFGDNNILTEFLAIAYCTFYMALVSYVCNPDLVVDFRQKNICFATPFLKPYESKYEN